MVTKEVGEGNHTVPCTHFENRLLQCSLHRAALEGSSEPDKGKESSCQAGLWNITIGSDFTCQEDPSAPAAYMLLGQVQGAFADIYIPSWFGTCLSASPSKHLPVPPTALIMGCFGCPPPHEGGPEVCLLKLGLLCGGCIALSFPPIAAANIVSL